MPTPPKELSEYKRGGGRRKAVWNDALRAKKREIIVACAEAGICRNISQVGRHHNVPRATIWKWMQNYPDFDGGLKAAWLGITERSEPSPVPDFVTFRTACFGHETFPHQQMWVDAIEANDLTLILVPPEHAKTTAVSIEYVTWRIAKDKNIRVVIVSKTQAMSRKILLAIKKRLTDHSWYQGANLRSVVREWGPFQPSEGERQRTPWTADMIYVAGIDSGEKDPTVEALGVGGQIYGARADLIILDDVATLKNQQSETEREKQLEWINQEVLTRLSDEGKLVIVGTRVHENDVYSTLLSKDVEWAQDFCHIVQPAIIDEEAKKVLWEKRWPYDKLVEKRRNRMRLRNWNLVFQQQSTGSPDNPFSLEALERAKDESYAVGQVAPGVPVVMGVDPALAGNLAITVEALDRMTGERWLIDCISRTNVRHPEVVKAEIVGAAQRYGAMRCRIESTAMQGFLSRDLDLKRRLLAVGCGVEEEYTTGSRKFDREWGVASVAAQFDEGLWHLPGAPGSEPKIRPLIEELAAWRPGAKVKQDRVMSLWLADLCARQLTSYRPGQAINTAKVPPWAKTRTIPRWVLGSRRRTATA